MNQLETCSVTTFLTQYMKRKRKELPLHFHDSRKGFSTFAGNGIPYPRITILLRTSGCNWLKSHGGCTMCGFAIDSLYPVPEVSPIDVIAQFEGEMKKYAHLKGPLTVTIFNNGSFFDSGDMPPGASNYILDTLSRDSRIREVRVETRPEFVRETHIKEVASLFKGGELHVAIGLEVCSDDIRQSSIHKGFTYRDFREAADIIQKVARLDVYLLLKPPFLTEGEALTAVVESISALVRTNPSTVYVTPCKVFPTTLLSDLEAQGLYRIPWLWSLLEIAKAAENLPFRLFLVKGDPADEEPLGGALGAKNCGKCDEKVKESIERFNVTQNLPEDLPTCTCREKWEESLSDSPFSLEERVYRFLKEVIDCE
ncbi:MAG: archaeosine biosynthesis radical SAM protein RaSEA [Theionarchaea archaeon]|nr:archaeosine biosynthesis radical SAM protein RaSEA [Theionarchaea archaeon]